MQLDPGFATDANAPNKREQCELPTRVGWRRDTSLRVFELSKDHPEYPEAWLSNENKRAWEQLSKSEVVADEVQKINELWSGKNEFIDELRKVIQEAERRARIVGDTELLKRVQESLNTIAGTLQRASYELHQYIDEVDHELITAYLAREILPVDIALFFETKSSPFSVIANAEEKLGVMIILHPGEFVIKGHNIGRKEVANQVGRFITEAQKLIDEQKGRRRKPGPKPDIERALAVMALKDQGLEAVEICDKLGLSYRTADEARRIVRDWLKRANSHQQKW